MVHCVYGYLKCGQEKKLGTVYSTVNLTVILTGFLKIYFVSF